GGPLSPGPVGGSGGHPRLSRLYGWRRATRLAGEWLRRGPHERLAALPETETLLERLASIGEVVLSPPHELRLAGSAPRKRLERLQRFLQVSQRQPHGRLVPHVRPILTPRGPSVAPAERGPAVFASIMIGHQACSANGSGV